MKISGNVLGFLVVLIFFLLIFLFSFAANKMARRAEKNMDPNHFSIRQPVLYLFPGCLFVLFSGLVFVFTLLYSPNIKAELLEQAPIFSIITFLGIFFILLRLRWKITVDLNQIVYTPVIGRKRSCSFTDITSVNNYSIFSTVIIARSGRKKMFRANSGCSGYNILVSRLKG
jgi:hypothetical protein